MMPSRGCERIARFYSRDAAAVLYRHASNQKGSSEENQSSTTQTSKETKTETKEQKQTHKRADFNKARFLMEG
jgi:hypothetical protein